MHGENESGRRDSPPYMCFPSPWDIRPGVPIVFDAFVGLDKPAEEGGDGLETGVEGRGQTREVGVTGARYKLEVYQDVTLPIGLGCRLDLIHTFQFFNAPYRIYHPSEDMNVDAFNPIHPYSLITEDYFSDTENPGYALKGISRYEVAPREHPDVVIGGAEVKRGRVKDVETANVKVTRLLEYQEGPEGEIERSVVWDRTGRMVTRRAALVQEDDVEGGKGAIGEYVVLDYV